MQNQSCNAFQQVHNGEESSCRLSAFVYMSSYRMTSQWSHDKGVLRMT